VTSPLLGALARALDAPTAPAPGAHVLVGTSGGTDSTALLAGLARLGADRGLVLTAGHVEHGLRGSEGRNEGRAVAALATRLGVGFETRPAAVAPGPGLEARARTARRAVLEAIADDVGATHIALAHTEDDQVETVLLRLLRGAGRRGLGGMRPLAGRIWRPLLAVSRGDVRRFLAEEGITAAVDRTNADLHHARNRLRRLVVPLLVREFNPRLGPAVAALAVRLRDEDDLLDELAAARAARHRRGAGLVVTVATEPPAVARRIVHGWLHEHAPRAASAAVVEDVLALATAPGDGRISLPGPGRVVRETDLLVHRSGRRSVAKTFRAEVREASTIAGPEDAWRLIVSEARPRATADPSGLGPSRAGVDADAIVQPLVVRSPAAGDRVSIPGVGTRKLQDVLVDAKVPRERRPLVPILADATGQIIWVAGIVRGAPARIGPATARVIDLTLA
jgi:tRNA(Ile)-lysidine synthase